MAERGIEGGVVCPRRFGQSLQPASVELDSINVAADLAAFGTRKIDPAVRLINAVQRARFPLARSQSAALFAIGCVVIDVLPARAFAQPEERAVFQPVRAVIIVGVDPGT